MCRVFHSSTAWHRSSLGMGPAQRHWGRDSSEGAPMERQGPQSVLGRILTFHKDARPHLTGSTLLAETFSPCEGHANLFLITNGVKHERHGFLGCV